MNLVLVNPRMYTQIHTPIVVQGGGRGVGVDGTPPRSFWYVAVLLFSPIGVERKSVKCKDGNLEFIYLAQTQTGNYHHLSVSNILSLSTRSNLFWSWNRVHLFYERDRYWRSDSTYAFFSSSSDKGISRGTVNFRYVNFTYGQIEGLDYIATVEGFPYWKYQWFLVIFFLTVIFS